MERYVDWVIRSVRVAGWAPLSVFGLHVVLAMGGAYDSFPSIDIPMHLLGGIVIAYFFAVSLTIALQLDLVGRPNRFALAILVIGSTCAAAIVWEFGEWGYDQFFPAPDARDYHDTLLDLALGMLGGGLYAAVWLRRPVASAPPIPDSA
jgi:hypothetical protein